MATRDDLKSYLTTNAASVLAAFDAEGVYEGQAPRRRPARLDVQVRYRSQLPVRRPGKRIRHHVDVIVSIHGRDLSAEDDLADTLEAAAEALVAAWDQGVSAFNTGLASVSVERVRCWRPAGIVRPHVTRRETTLKLELDEWGT